jgi:glucokinase
VQDDPARLNGEIIARAAQQGDAVSQGIWRVAGEALALGVFTLDRILGPEVIIIGGALTQAGEILFKPMRDKLQQESRRYDPELVRLAALGEKTGLMGGVALALRALEGVEA